MNKLKKITIIMMIVGIVFNVSISSNLYGVDEQLVVGVEKALN